MNYKRIANDLDGQVELIDYDEGSVIIFGSKEDFEKQYKIISEKYNNGEISDDNFFQEIENRLPNSVGFIVK